MNLINVTLIDLLITAADTLKVSVAGILQQYRNDRDREKQISLRYKDESGYFSEKQKQLAAYAREAIAKAERIFCHKAEEVAGQMESELQKHLSMPVNGEFREQLKMMYDFGLQPEKIEIDHLLSLNGGNQTGLAALAKTLEKVDSDYILKYHSTADYQADIAKVRDLPRNLKLIPVEYHSEGVEVYKDQKRDYTYPGGGTVTGKYEFDSISLLNSTAAFDSAIESIKGMKDTWTADCSYAEADRKAEQAQEAQRQVNKFLTNAGLPAEEINNPESGTRIEDNPENSQGMQIARKMGQDEARARDTYSDLRKAAKLL